MNRPLKEEYLDLLTQYMETGEDQYLYAAHEFGWSCLEAGLLPEEVKSLHYSCIEVLAAQGASHDEVALAQRLLLEVLLVFSVGYRELMTQLNDAKKALEEKNIRLQELSDFKTKMISIVAHDVRGPLSAIKEYIRLTAETHARDQESVNLIECLVDQVRKIETLVQDFLEHSRIEAARVEMQIAPTKLSPVIEQAVALLGHGSDHDVVMEGTFPEVMGDPDRLVQIFQNLMGNALKYSPHGGKITIAGRMSDREAVVSISDEGIGIPDEDLQGIFLPFHRSARSEKVGIPGTGLGLSIVKLLVEQQGGKIWAESKGTGSTFCVTFPLAPGESAAPAS